MSKGKKPQPWFKGRQRPLTADDIQIIDLEPTEPLTEEQLDWPVYRFVNGQLIRVADRARDRMPTAGYTEYVPPPDPPAATPSTPKPDEPAA